MNSRITMGLLCTAMLSGAALAAAQSQAPLAIAPADPALRWGACPPIFPGACEIAVLQGDPAKPNADVLLKVGPGYRLPPHRHSSAERMIMVGGKLRVRYSGAEPVTLEPGTYAYGPAKLPHEGECVSDDPCLLFIAFEGPVDAEPVAAPI